MVSALSRRARSWTPPSRPRLTTTLVGLAQPDLVGAWRELQDADGVTSPFTTWQWTAALACVPEISQAVRVIRVARGARTVGLLAVERWCRADGLRVLGLAGAEWLGPDHIDIVASAEEREPAAAAAARFLLR